MASLALIATAPAGAAVDADPRMLAFDALQQVVVHIPTSQEVTQVVLFPPGEQVQSVIVSDPRAYNIDVASDGESLSLRAISPGAYVMLVVRTDRRTYDIELAPGEQGGRVPPVVRFVTLAGTNTNAELEVRSEPLQAASATWRLSGNKQVMPELVRDDGTKTFIGWREDQALPAVFAIGPSGQEEAVDGFMRLGFFTIDRVHERLVFRIDKVAARAQRITRRGENDRK